MVLPVSMVIHEKTIQVKLHLLFMFENFEKPTERFRKGSRYVVYKYKISISNGDQIGGRISKSDSCPLRSVMFSGA